MALSILPDATDNGPRPAPPTARPAADPAPTAHQVPPRPPGTRRRNPRTRDPGDPEDPPLTRSPY